MSFVDLQTVQAELQSLATTATSKAAALEASAPTAILAELLPKAMEPQPGAFSQVLRALANEDLAGKFAGFLASPAGGLVEPGAAANLTEESVYFNDHIRQHLANLAQAFDDAVAQVMAGGGGQPGEQGGQ